MRVVDARVFDDLWDKVDENLTGDFGGRCFIVCPLSWWQYAMCSCVNMGVFFACSSGNRRFSRPVKRSQTSYFA